MSSEENMQKDHPVLAVLDVAKKPVDILDDAWSASRGALPASTVESVGPFIIAPLMFFIHLVEAYHGYLEAWETYNNEQEKQRKTKFFVALMTFLIASCGVGLSLTYIGLSTLAVIGVVTAAAGLVAVLPIVLPAMLGTIYSLALGRKSYVLHQVKKEEAIAREEYLAYIRQPEFQEGVAGVYLRDYQQLHEERLEAEKAVAMGVVEVAASILVVTGIALSILSSGMLPLALLITGVVIGTLGKLYEYVDTKYNGALSDRLRNWLGIEVESSELQKVPEQQAKVKKPSIVKDYKSDPYSYFSKSQPVQEQKVHQNPYSFKSFLAQGNQKQEESSNQRVYSSPTPNMVR